MENFKFKRCWHTFVWYFRENSRRFWAIGSAITLVILLIEVFFAWMVWKTVDQASFRKEMANLTQPYCMFILFVGLMFAYSSIFSLLRKRQKRIAFLTLPATNAERFAAVLFYTVVVGTVWIVLAFIVGDTLRMPITWMLGQGWGSNIHPVLESMGFIPSASSWTETVEIASIYSIMMWICSLYILGGTWLRKGAFIWVSAALLTIFTVGVRLIATYTSYRGMFVKDVNNQIEHVMPSAYPIIFAIFLIALFNIWLSYQLFKRYQLVTPKWTNV